MEDGRGHGLVTVGVTVANEGNIHGEAGLRLTLQECDAGAGGDMGDFIFVRDLLAGGGRGGDRLGRERRLLPGEHRFLFGSVLPRAGAGQAVRA